MKKYFQESLWISKLEYRDVVYLISKLLELSWNTKSGKMQLKKQNYFLNCLLIILWRLHLSFLIRIRVKMNFISNWVENFWALRDQASAKNINLLSIWQEPKEDSIARVKELITNEDNFCVSSPWFLLDEHNYSQNITDSSKNR